VNGNDQYAQGGESLDLRAFLALLGRRKWLIAGMALVCSLAFWAVALLMTPTYRVSTLLSPARNDSGMGGLGGAAGQLGGLAALAGLAVTGGASTTEESLAVLESQEFTERFISEMGILPKLYPSKWDASKGKWKVDAREAPTLARASKQFSDHIRQVARDRKTGLITLSIDWRDRQEAMQWNRRLVEMINDEMRRRAMVDSSNNIAYLENELAATTPVETRLAISRLLETQIKQRMLAKVTREFAFRTVDPGTVPDEDDMVRPRKLRLFVLGPIVGVMLGVGYVLLAWVFFGPAARRREAAEAEDSLAGPA